GECRRACWERRRRTRVVVDGGGAPSLGWDTPPARDGRPGSATAGSSFSLMQTRAAAPIHRPDYFAARGESYLSPARERQRRHHPSCRPIGCPPARRGRLRAPDRALPRRVTGALLPDARLSRRRRGRPPGDPAPCLARLATIRRTKLPSHLALP